MEPNAASPFSDQLANISPVVALAVVMALTVVRIAIAKIRDPWARTLAEICDTFNFVLILAFLLIRPFVAQAFYIPSESMRDTLLVHDRLIVDKFSYRLHPPHRHDVVVFEAPPEATPERVDGIDFIKRLIGEPGDTIQVKAARVIVGDEEITSGPDGSGKLGAHEFVRETLGLSPEESVKFFPDHILIDGTRVVSPQELAVQAHEPPSSVRILPGETLVNDQIQYEPYTREDPDRNFPRSGVLTVPAGHLFMMGDNRNYSEDSTYWGPLDATRVVGHAAVVFWPLPRAGWIR
jgi:signal peptidase I